MADRRIFYVSKNFGYPLGGVRISHHHVRLLVKNGYDAAILLRQDRPQPFFQSDVPIQLLSSEFRARRGDIYVVPEPWGDILAQLSDKAVRKIVFCQNHFYIPHGLGRHRDYAAYGVDTVLCCGDVIAAFLRGTFGLRRVPIVHNAIDQALFKPAAKRRQIALMPRKMAKEAEFVRMCLRLRHPAFAEVPWVPIDMVPEPEVARLLGESAVFLCLSRLEGVGLPPLEAMAAGCLVVGFTGGGGLEFATPENGYWCQSDDLIGTADGLARALALFDGDPAGYRVRRAAAAETARRYDLERMERELLAFWREECAP
jgi:hypothetical protein